MKNRRTTPSPRWRFCLWMSLSFLILLQGAAVAQGRPPVTDDTIAAAIDHGLAWLVSRQDEQGAWGVVGCGPNVGVTAQGAYVFLLAGHNETDPVVRRALDYVLTHRREDGSFASQHPDCGRAVYETSLAIMALATTGNPEYHPVLDAATQWLVEAQNDESEVDESASLCPNPESCWAWGGWCYDRASCVRAPDEEADQTPFTWSDNSNSQFAIMALAVAQRIGLWIPEETWGKAENWVTRCRYPDGGYGYQPPRGVPDQGPYGSMTAAAIWELGAMGVPHDDPRIQRALAWLEAHHRPDGNPWLGPEWHYYYLWTAARGLLPIERIGGLSDWPRLSGWFEDVAGFLLAHQGADGSWSSPFERYGENPGEELITQYALQVLLKAEVPEGIYPIND